MSKKTNGIQVGNFIVTRIMVVNMTGSVLRQCQVFGVCVFGMITECFPGFGS